MPGRITDGFDVVVVGAGWNGLIAAQTYLKLAPETNLLIVDDGESIGGTWSKEKIYPSLFAQISHPLFEYSFYPMKKKDISPDGYIPGSSIHEYLASFADEYGLTQRTRLRTKVVCVTRASDKGWVVELDEGPTLKCAKLIYATGPTSSKIIPTWPQKDFGKPIVHSQGIGAYLDHIHSSNVESATVVGAAKSAFDLVFMLLRAGKKVDWIIRKSASGPLSISAPTFIGLWNTVNHVSTRMAASFSPSIMNTSGFWYHFLQRTASGRAVTSTYWRTSTFPSARHAEYGANDTFEKLRPHPYGYGMFWGSGGIGIASVPDFWKVLHAGDLTIHQTEIESFSYQNVVNLKDGHSVSTDFVVLCTGFDKGYKAFTPELQADCNLYYDLNEHSRWTDLDKCGEEEVDKLLPFLKDSPEPPMKVPSKPSHGPSRHYRRLIIPHMAAQGDRSILFPGQVHSVFTPLTGELQALWGVAFLLGWLDLPSQETMELEAATFNAWTRKRYLEQGKKHAYFIYDYLSYIDTLTRDLGLKVERKNNRFAEMFSPYRPSDYRGLTEEFLTVRAKKIKR